MAISKAATLGRVSDMGQHTDNQLSALTAWAVRRGFEVAATYEFQESAWKVAQQAREFFTSSFPQQKVASIIGALQVELALNSMLADTECSRIAEI